jgi:hypothetical protein
MQKVFSERPYFDDIIKREISTYKVCYNNFISNIYSKFGIIHPTQFLWIKIDDKRCHDDSFMFICKENRNIEAAASNSMISTNLKSAIYADYMAFIQSFLSQIFYLSSSKQLKKFGFSSQEDKETEVERLSFIYQDLRLAVTENINDVFTDDERSSILRLID